MVISMRNFSVILLVVLFCLLVFILDRNIKTKNEISNYKIQVDKYEQQMETLNTKYSELRIREKDQRKDADGKEKDLNEARMQIERLKTLHEREKSEILAQLQKEKDAQNDLQDKMSDLRKEHNSLQEQMIALKNAGEKQKHDSEVNESQVVIDLKKQISRLKDLLVKRGSDILASGLSHSTHLQVSDNSTSGFSSVHNSLPVSNLIIQSNTTISAHHVTKQNIVHETTTSATTTTTTPGSKGDIRRDNAAAVGRPPIAQDLQHNDQLLKKHVDESHDKTDNLI